MISAAPTDKSRLGSCDGQGPSENREPSSVIRRRVAKNVTWNWAGVAVDVVVGFLLAPFLIRNLGDSVYGLWVLIGSLTGYMGRLDFGFRGAVGRFVAFYGARSEHDGILYTVNAATGMLSLLGGFAFALSVCMALALPMLFEVPAGDIESAQLAMIVVGVHLAVFLVCRVFDAMLWGYQRFDLLNMVDIPAAAFQGIGSALVVSKGGGLVGLALVTLATTVGVGVTKLCLCLWQTPFVRLSPRLFRWANVLELANYGIWNSMVSIAATAGRQLAPVVVGVSLGLVSVAMFSVARRLVVYSSMVLSSSVGVMVPLTSKLFAEGDDARQRKLFVKGGVICVAITVMFFQLFALFGGVLLELWINESFREAWLPLMILATGELLPMSAEMSKGTIQGMAKHRALAWRGIAEGIVGLGGGAVLSQWWGVSGMCAGIAFGRTWFSGVFVLSFGCRLVGISLCQFCREVVKPVLLSASVPFGFTALVISVAPVKTWLGLVCASSVFVLINVVAFAYMVLSRSERMSLIEDVRHRFQ